MSKKLILLSTIAVLFTAVIMQPASQVDALSIASLSQTKGSTSGGNNLTVSGTDFIADEQEEVVQIVAGHQFSLALTRTNNVYSCGLNIYGALADGTTDNVHKPQNVTSQFNGEMVTELIADGGDHAFALTKSGKIFAWGRNANGQLGNGTNANTSTPQDISSQFDSTVVKVWTGVYNSFAITSSGKVYAWGANGQGQLGTSDSVDYNVPQDITAKFGGETVEQISGGSAFTVFLTTANSIYTVGFNTQGQLGDGTTTNNLNLQNITSAFSSTIIKVEAGAYTSYALASNGSLYSWGRGVNGEIGDGVSAGVNMTPINITSQFAPDIVTDVIAGYYYAFARTDGGKLYSWGDNSRSQLAINGGTSYNSPQDITNNVGQYNTKQLVAGGYHSFILADEGLIGWGNNSYGQLGNDNTTDSYQGVDISTRFMAPTVQIESIYFGSSKVKTFQVLDANTISLIVPSHSAGFVDVIINDIHGRTITLANGYEYITIGAPNTGNKV